MQKLTAQNSPFLARVKAQMNAPVYDRVRGLVNEAGDIHAADAYLGSLFASSAREKTLAAFHAPKQAEATDLNIFALRSYLKGGSDAQPGATDRSFPNAIAKVDAPHIRRCIKAGLVETTGKELVLTEAGCKRLGLRPALQLDAGITVAEDGTVSIDGSELTQELGDGRTVRCSLLAGRFDFSGGYAGGHSLDADLSCTPKERLVAHWNGYCSNNIRKEEA